MGKTIVVPLWLRVETQGFVGGFLGPFFVSHNVMKQFWVWIWCGTILGLKFEILKDMI